jgi:hypothetical protein
MLDQAKNIKHPGLLASAGVVDEENLPRNQMVVRRETGKE